MSSATGLLNAIAVAENDVFGTPRTRQPMWFRGLRSSAYELVPTWKRWGRELTVETALKDRFKQNAIAFLDPVPPDNDEWAWMFLMRHHGAPSRLLDWSESPLVALFFAVEQKPTDSPLRPEEDGAVWVLLPRVLNESANLDIGPALPFFRSGSDLDAWVSPDTAADISPAAGIGRRNSPRMAAQQGVFTIHGPDLKSLELWHAGEHVWRYIIPKDDKGPIREELRRMGITRLTVYPDLDSVAIVAKEALDA